MYDLDLRVKRRSRKKRKRWLRSSIHGMFCIHDLCRHWLDSNLFVRVAHAWLTGGLAQPSGQTESDEAGRTVKTLPW